MRVVDVVKDDKAGINRLITPPSGQHCPRMTAKSVIGFDQGDVVALGEGPCAGKPRNAAANNSDAQGGFKGMIKWHSVYSVNQDFLVIR